MQFPTPLERLDKKIDDRHAANETRFDKIEQAVSYIKGQLKIIVTLLIANGAIDIYRVINGK